MPPRYIELGVSGLSQSQGVVTDEWLRQLTGERGRRLFREMADNDATVGGVLFSIEMLLRNVQWHAEPFDASPTHKERAEFVETLMDDMAHTWGDFVAEALSMLVYGFAPHEIIYKQRVGPTEKDPTKRSRYRDGLVGWRKLPLRAQITLDRWEFDTDGGIKGMWQLLPSGGTVFIPIEKMLLFRTTSRKNNPEGRSALRNAYIAYYNKKHIATVEGIGVERDLAGMPVFYLPPELFDPDASDDVKAQLGMYRKIMSNIRNDEQTGLCLPSVYDEKGNQILKFELVGTNGRRLFDTNAIIARYDRQITMTMLADFLLLGHESVGSFALSSDKTTMFATALGAWLKELASVINRHALPRLFDMNNWPADELPELVPGDLEKPDLERFAQAVTQLTGGGWLTPGAEPDENHIRDLVGLPPVAEDAVRPPPTPPQPPPPNNNTGPNNNAGPRNNPGRTPDPSNTNNARGKVAALRRPFEKYDAAQPRDKDGKWTNGGGGVVGLPAGAVLQDRELQSLIESDRYDLTAQKVKENWSYGTEAYDIQIQAKGGEGLTRYKEESRYGGLYDPALATLDADGYPRPRDGLLVSLPESLAGDTILRGMSAEEYAAFQQSGVIQSRGDWNIGAQQAGLTYWTKDPSQAVSYANGFAPAQFKPTFAKPAYVVVARAPAASDIRQVAGTGASEVGVTRPIIRDEVVAVYIGRVYATTNGIKDVTYHTAENKITGGGGVAPSAQVVWELAAKKARANTNKYDAAQPRDKDGKWTTGGGGGGQTNTEPTDNSTPSDHAEALMQPGGTPELRADIHAALSALSPELLVQLKKDGVTVKPIAGVMPEDWPIAGGGFANTYAGMYRGNERTAYIPSHVVYPDGTVTALSSTWIQHTTLHEVGHAVHDVYTNGGFVTGNADLGVITNIRFDRVRARLAEPANAAVAETARYYHSYKEMFAESFATNIGASRGNAAPGSAFGSYSGASMLRFLFRPAMDAAETITRRYASGERRP